MKHGGDVRIEQNYVGASLVFLVEFAPDTSAEIVLVSSTRLSANTSRSMANHRRSSTSANISLELTPHARPLLNLDTPLGVRRRSASDV